PSAEDLLELPSVAYARIELPIGFHMRGSISDTIGRVGQVLLHAPTTEAFLAAGELTVAWFDERLQVLPTTLTPAELRRSAGEQRADAVHGDHVHGDRVHGDHAPAPAARPPGTAAAATATAAATAALRAAA